MFHGLLRQLEVWHTVLIVIQAGFWTSNVLLADDSPQHQRRDFLTDVSELDKLSDDAW